MNISKVENFNKYLQKIFSIFVLFSLSLVPWIEFINTNLNELDFIFNNNFIILLILYFLFIFIIYLILSYFTSLSQYSLISLIAITVWILFQHNFLKKKIFIFLNNINISGQYSSELGLILILFSIYFFWVLIKRKKFFTNFFILFLAFNLFYSISQFSLNSYLQNKEVNFVKPNNNSSMEKSKRPNIYFFILDAMMPLNEFEDYFKEDLSTFKKFYSQKDYIYFKDTLNFYPDTTDTLTSIFFLEDIFIEPENYEISNLKPNIYRKFPGLLSKRYNPVLISELNKLGYEFKWIGNSFADCSKYNYKYCVTNKKEEYIDLYLLQSFLEKTPLIQIFNKLTEPDIVQKYFQINQRGDAIGKLKKFLISSKNYIKLNTTFYFIHHMHPHWPYKHDSECNYKNYPGNTNFEGYKNSYLCVVKKMSSIINSIEQLDRDAIVIFQSDHSWEMSKISEIKYGNRKQIFNLVKNNIQCEKIIPKGLNNVQIANYLINCLKNN